MITGGTSGIGLAVAHRVIAAASFAPFWLCLDVRFAPNNDPNGGHSKMVETVALPRRVRVRPRTCRQSFLWP